MTDIGELQIKIREQKEKIEFLENRLCKLEEKAKDLDTNNLQIEFEKYFQIRQILFNKLIDIRAKEIKEIIFNEVMKQSQHYFNTMEKTILEFLKNEDEKNKQLKFNFSAVKRIGHYNFTMLQIIVKTLKLNYEDIQINNTDINQDRVNNAFTLVCENIEKELKEELK